ncbi:hypothetical protein GCM10007938_02180 [Vibrio zhanjiangensis]|uniref:Sulphur transport domain-containing protein n=1 Tax=Vibrio zhanjiangensis TaxID=1046128 RepID=A0ABQ6ETX1_9VIBR|nr:DUF6691 family protein [Vibrio zhanjiangensis]GLT16442.1 hypothetical protein GCM10007938_02180 [Vibrio zhanjiangensis]
MNLVLAVILGSLFGYTLYRVGATHADKIVDMLTLRDLSLAKTIILAIGLSSTVYFSGIALGVFDPSHLSVKGMYLGVILGGVLLGIGWALSGMCPGTGVTNLGAGRKDALFFVVGGLLGAGVFSALYEYLAAFGLFQAILGGKAALANPTETPWIAIIIGIAFVAAAILLPKRLPSHQDSVSSTQHL